MKVDQEEVTPAIAAARSAAHGDDAEAAEATVRSARLGGPDAVRLLRHIIRAEGVSVPQRVHAACAVLEVGHFLGGYPSSESRPAGAFEEPKGTDGAGERDGT